MKHELPASVWRHFDEFSPGGTQDIEVFFAPGRVNLIGEHTDYNGGYVLPAALTLGVYALVRPRQDGVLRFASTGFGGVVTSSMDELVYREPDDFANYPKGVISVLAEKNGVKFKGADFLFHGTLPHGAGLSSSAAIELATAVGVVHLAGVAIPNDVLALISQQAENQFVGVNCGIMDQFAVAMGRSSQAISLNCKTLQYRLVGIPAGDHRIVITNTNKRRGLADSKYNERRAECEHALADLQKIRPELTCLADVSPSEWEDVESAIQNDVWKRRARHVVFENHRAITATEVLEQGDILAFGRMMNESHCSLRDDYEVTGAELDALAEAAWGVEGCIGSRMTGAGFGGCTVSLVAADRVDVFREQVARLYAEKTGLNPSFYVCEIGDGARRLDKTTIIR